LIFAGRLTSVVPVCVFFRFVSVVKELHIFWLIPEKQQKKKGKLTTKTRETRPVNRFLKERGTVLFSSTPCVCLKTHVFLNLKLLLAMVDTDAGGGGRAGDDSTRDWTPDWIGGCGGFASGLSKNRRGRFLGD
jgi:hypothetical protein